MGDLLKRTRELVERADLFNVVGRRCQVVSPRCHRDEHGAGGVLGTVLAREDHAPQLRAAEVEQRGDLSTGSR